MRFVYCIAFRGEEFVMVFNPKREGWEMPGGRVEEGETDLQAVQREFREEVGHDFLPAASIQLGEGAVFTGEIGRWQGEGEMDWCTFKHLPSQLSFPLVEYVPLIEWAMRELTLVKAQHREVASA